MVLLVGAFTAQDVTGELGDRANVISKGCKKAGEWFIATLAENDRYDGNHLRCKEL